MTIWTMTEVMSVWTKGSNDGFGGTTYTRMDDIPTKWANKIDKIIDKDGVEHVTNFRAYTFYQLKVGDFILKGTSTSETPEQGAKQVRHTSKIPSSINLIMAVA